MAHLNEAPEEVASLLASNKLNGAECIDNTRVSLWVDKQGVLRRESRYYDEASNTITIFKSLRASHFGFSDITTTLTARR